MLVDGPVGPDPDWAARERWFVDDFGVPKAEYRLKSRPSLAALDEGAPTVLWFEDDLFCHANLLYILSRAPADGSWSLVCTPEVLGGRPAQDFRRLHETRRTLVREDTRLARHAWECYAGPDPRKLEAFAREPIAAWPGLVRSLRAHLTRFPDRTTGLDGIETWFLRALEPAPKRFRELFAAFAFQEQATGWGIGDAQAAWRLRSLAGGDRPLLRIEGAAWEPASWRLSLTPDGQRVLAGRADRSDLVGLDRWIGGVRVRSPGPMWRWDAAGGGLVRA